MSIFLALFRKELTGFQEQSVKHFTKIMVRAIRCCSQSKPFGHVQDRP